jgi:ATP-dependent Clp protease protease subunit
MHFARPLQPPADVYASFIGEMNEESAQKLHQNLAAAVNGRVQRFHLLFSSNGGGVGHGIGLYNFFRTLPIDLILYNTGAVSSAGVTAYLGAKRRKVSKHAMFMLHRIFTASLESVPANVMRSIADSLEIADRNNQQILRSHINLPEEKWQIFHERDLSITAEEAVTFGIADEIADFTPPLGTLYSI